MNREEKLLISICRSYLDGSTPALPDDTDWRVLYRLAKNHNLIGICHCVLDNNRQLDIPDNVRRLFTDRFLDLVLVFTTQTNIIEDIRQCFCENEIDFIFFKGASIRSLYPTPESRSMSDIDVLIRDKDRDRARALLEGIGFECYAPNGTVREFKRDNYILEVHTRIISEFGDDAFNDAFENAVMDGNEGRLDDTYHFAYLIAHAAHHFRFYGAGLKMVLDLAVMLKRTSIDLDRVLEILSPLRLDTFAKELLSVVYHLFGVGREYNKVTDKTEQYLMKCGAFGSLNENKGAVVIRRDMQNGAGASPVLSRLRLAFPSYERMKNIPYIKFIEGRRWLTPYAWCYRLVYNFKRRGSFTKKTIHDIDENASAMAKAEIEYFEEIGLI